MILPLATTFHLANEGAGEDVTDAVLDDIAKAIDHELRNSVKGAWGGEYRCGVSGQESPTASVVVVHIQADSTVQGAAGFHDDGGVYVFRDGLPSLTSGAFSLSVVISHEIFETIGDPGANRWALAADGTLYALELCDAVEGYSFESEVNKVSLSDFLLPSFFDPDGSAPFSIIGKASAPFTTAPDSGSDYQITMSPGNEAQVTAARNDKHGARSRAKAHPSSRTSRRLKMGR